MTATATAQSSGRRWRIQGERLQRSIAEMAQIGALPTGGNCRLALTDEDRQARDLFVRWCREAGCEVQWDAYGNIFAFRQGRDACAPVVLTGSHLDTQPEGGHFDGIYGVLAGLEVLRALNDAAIQTHATLAIVNWTNEEGVRYAPGLTGSSAFTGVLAHEDAWALVGTDGCVYGDELRRIGYAGTLRPASLNIGAYVEAHIEQGPILERLGKPVGAVTGIQGVRWFEVSVQGANRHAGTTPMQDRQDSFMAAARYVLAWRAAARALSPDVRFTVGRLRLAPDSVNTIPGTTVFSVDVRHEDAAVLDQVEAMLRAGCSRIDAEERVTMQVRALMTVPPVRFADDCIDAVEQAARATGHPVERMVSGAMHDASRMAALAPTSMVFVPSRDGISHHPDEWTDPQDLVAGCEVLADTLLRLAGTG